MFDLTRSWFRRATQWLRQLSVYAMLVLRYLGISQHKAVKRVATAEDLACFVEDHSNYVAQVTLYGYLKTRAGTRFPELFEHRDMLRSINQAKWLIWADCLSDLLIYTGCLLTHNGHFSHHQARQFLTHTLAHISAQTGTPPDANAQFGRSMAQIRTRLESYSWHNPDSIERIFHHSEASLGRWAPVSKRFIHQDSVIISQSVRYKWIDVRRKLKQRIGVHTLHTEFLKRVNDTASL